MFKSKYRKEAELKYDNVCSNCWYKEGFVCIYHDVSVESENTCKRFSIKNELVNEVKASHFIH